MVRVSASPVGKKPEPRESIVGSISRSGKLAVKAVICLGQKCPKQKAKPARKRPPLTVSCLFIEQKASEGETKRTRWHRAGQKIT